MNQRDEGAADLPRELADLTAETLLALPADEWAGACEELALLHPGHAAALRRLCADLAATERLLASAHDDGRAEDAAQLGGHHVLRRLGEGAFGIVYLCQQTHPVQRQVAVKVLRPGTGDRGTLRRFASERQVLAQLAHPAITQVFDAGELPDGRPYFVMEYVAGANLRDYCTARTLSCTDRLRLFLEVCRGVAHAHHRGIVHRDLKPANVLVVDTEQGPRAKVIDFGIAKALSGDGADGEHTGTGRVIGTPGYMSPEQAAGHGAEVDARADVFSLGVMLYELLTGEMPWPRGTTTDSEPVRPSARVATTTRTAAKATTGPRLRLAAALRGDLDWILLKAIARDRTARYAAVTDLIDDIERHLRGAPVAAGPPSVVYRLRKFYRRHRAATLVGVGLLVTGSGWLASQWRSAALDAARRQAEGDAASRGRDAAAAVELLLQRANDERMRERPENDELRRALVRDALTFYDRWLADRPEDGALRRGRCRALITLSQVHWQLGQPKSAASLASEAVAEARAVLAAAPTDLDTHGLLADALRRLGRALAAELQAAQAKAPLVEAIEHLEACFAAAPQRHGLSLSSGLRELASIDDDASARLDATRRSVAVLEQLGSDGAADPQVAHDLVIARCALARSFASDRRLDEADRVLQAAVTGAATLSKDREWAEAMVRGTRGRLARQRNDVATAIAELELAVAAGERWRAAEPRRLVPGDMLIQDLRELASSRDDAGRWDAADTAMRRALQVAEMMVAEFPEATSRLAVHYSAAMQFAQMKFGRFRQDGYAEALAAAQAAVDLHDRWCAREPGRRDERWAARYCVAALLDARGQDSAAAWQQVRETLPAIDNLQQRSVRDRFAAWLSLAQHDMRQGRFGAAGPELERAAALVGLHKGRQLGELEYGRAQYALGIGDAAGVAAAVDRMVAAHETWLTRWRAGDYLLRVSRLPSASPEQAKVAKDNGARALDCFRRVAATLAADAAKDPDDPWYVVPWGCCNLQLAIAEAAAGDFAAAAARLAQALPALDRVAAQADRGLWQADLLEQARALQRTLQAGTGR